MLVTDETGAPRDRPDPLIGHHDRFNDEYAILLDAPAFYAFVLGSKYRYRSIVS
jgi:hypothetical protein